ncbi:MAG TPA: ketol-acid reductoisomerase [Firmicutes bacterium]|nr:ketol-acid reductoisomerase [Bacillota bacterium]
MISLEKKSDILKSRKVAVIGYGNQGRPQALNLKDGGIDVSVILRKESSSAARARQEGFQVFTPEEGMKRCDFFVVLIPDEAQPDFFLEHVYHRIREEQAFVFAHGFSFVFGGLELKKYPVDIGMISPKGPGKALRERFLSGEGLPGVMAVEKDFSGTLRETLISYAYYTGLLKRGLFETTFEEETVCDLFGEQVSLCGLTIDVMKRAFAALVRGGYSPEMAYFETVFEMKAIVDLIYKEGIEGMRKAVSDTAEFGSYEASKELPDKKFDQRLDRWLEDIKQGGFAKRWMAEYRNGKKTLYEEREKEKGSLIGETERRMKEKGIL